VNSALVTPMKIHAKLLVVLLLTISASQVLLFGDQVRIASANITVTTITVETSNSTVYVGENFTVTGRLTTQDGRILEA